MEKINKFTINPVFLKELKTVVRNRKLAATTMIYNAILALVGIVSLAVTFESNNSGIDHESVIVIYVILTILEFFLICFAIPAYTASSISGEREKQTLEILLTTPMSTTRIAIGKLLSGMSTILLLVFSSLPVISLVFTIGGISAADVLKYMFFIFITAIYVGSFGVMFSSIFKKTTIATVVTYATLIFMGIGTIVILVIAYLVMDNYYTQMYLSGQMAYNMGADLGYGSLLLLINPGITLASLLLSNFGGENLFYDIMMEVGTVADWLLNGWFYISMAVQLVIAASVVFFTGKILNPVKRKRKRK